MCSSAVAVDFQVKGIFCEWRMYLFRGGSLLLCAIIFFNRRSNWFVGPVRFSEYLSCLQITSVQTATSQTLSGRGG